jgi:hypothetical protein
MVEMPLHTPLRVSKKKRSESQIALMAISFQYWPTFATIVQSGMTVHTSAVHTKSVDQIGEVLPYWLWIKRSTSKPSYKLGLLYLKSSLAVQTSGGGYTRLEGLHLEILVRLIECDFEACKESFSS